jgi:16S rRNA processing protein RimM
LPKPDEGEYYWADLIGLRVSTEAGDDLGTLREIIETGSNDVYVVKGACREFLIPATDDVVRGIDLDAGTMTVSPLEGMLDL